MNNNKGITWARKTRALNKGKSANHWDIKVDCLGGDELERLCVKLVLAWKVLDLHGSPEVREQAKLLNWKWTEEGNPTAAVFHAYGMVILAELIQPGCTNMDTPIITWFDAVGASS